MKHACKALERTMPLAKALCFTAAAASDPACPTPQTGARKGQLRPPPAGMAANARVFVAQQTRCLHAGSAPDC